MPGLDRKQQNNPTIRFHSAGISSSVQEARSVVDTLMMTTHSVVLVIFTVPVQAAPPELGGVKVGLHEYQGPASVAAERTEAFRMRINIDPKGETRPLSLRVELPQAGRNAWPAADVEVRDAGGKPLLVQRSGIEWEKLLIPLPAGVTTCVVQAVEPTGGWPKTTTEKDRTIRDDVSGVQVTITNWHAGRAAALSIRFDDSHPTHLSKVAPILREYGFRGTFMVNPGPTESGSRRISEFDRHRDEWKSMAEQGAHELANHSAHHRGASGDEDMDAEIGRAAEAIWTMRPGKSKLTALNLGGGTRWTTTHTLRHYLVKYHQFDASSGSLGMDDSYGKRVEAFRQMLDQHIARKLWCRIHYHYIGDGLSTSETNFRAALDVAKEHQEKLWIAGMAEIYKYQTERGASQLTLIESNERRLVFQLACATDPTLYDQPLTLEFVIPATWSAQKVTVKDTHGTLLPTTQSKAGTTFVLRVDAPPRGAAYSVSVAPSP